MGQYAAVADDVGEDATSPQAIIGTLQEVLVDAERFLTGWFERVQKDIDLYQPPATRERDLEKRIEAFQLEKVQWEAKRRTETKQMEEQIRELTNAWLRLEAEQRQMLQIRHVNRVATAHIGTAGNSTHGNQDIPTGSNPHRSSGSSPVIDGDPSRGSKASAVGVSRNVIRQFQRLQREIETSRPDSV